MTSTYIKDFFLCEISFPYAAYRSGTAVSKDRVNKEGSNPVVEDNKTEKGFPIDMENKKIEVLSDDKTTKCSLEINFESGAVFSVFDVVDTDVTNTDTGGTPSQDAKGDAK